MDLFISPPRSWRDHRCRAHPGFEPHGRRSFFEGRRRAPGAIACPQSCSGRISQAGISKQRGADKLRRHEHAISVALSQVDYAEASALYREAIHPALNTTLPPEALQECFTLLERWSLIDQITPDDAASIANKLVARIKPEQETEHIGIFDSSIADLAPRLNGSAAASITDQLALIATSSDPSLIHDTVRTLNALAPRLSNEKRRDLAAGLASRLASETERRLLIALAPAFPPLCSTLDSKTANEATSALGGRESSRSLIRDYWMHWSPHSAPSRLSPIRRSRRVSPRSCYST